MAQTVPTDVWDLTWRILNSPIGVVLATAIIGHILAYIWKREPTWQKLWMENKGVFFDAVRFAETSIPDSAQDSASARAKQALSYIVGLQGGGHPAAQANPADIARAIEATHAVESQKPPVMG